MTETLQKDVTHVGTQLQTKTPVTVAYGDGIGPEIMSATLRILEAAGARLEIEKIDIREKIYLQGNSAGIQPEAWESLRRTKRQNSPLNSAPTIITSKNKSARDEQIIPGRFML